MDKKAFGGRVNYAEYKVVKDHLAGQLEMDGVSADKASALAQSLLPSADDWFGTRNTKVREGMAQFKTRESQTPNLDGIPGLKPPFPGPPKLSAEKKGAKGGAAKEKAPAGEQYKTVGGVRYKRGPKGEAIKVD